MGLSGIDLISIVYRMKGAIALCALEVAQEGFVLMIAS
jgi:hypothetical protein